MTAKKFSPHNVAVAAEAFAAAVLAHAGYDISIQYGANRPGYDIVAIKDHKTWRVSVKGSQDNGWVLATGHKNKNNSYHDAIDEWLKRQDTADVFVFVQFHSVELGTMPHIYVATPKEVAKVLKARCNGHGDTVLAVEHTYTRGKAAGTTDQIPPNWAFSKRSNLP